MILSTLNLGILILAAGESKRLGRAKQLLDWNGETLLQKSISTAEQLSSKHNTEIHIVLGARCNELLPYIKNKDIVICHNERWFTGIGSSIQCGIKEIESRGKFDAVLIMLCDQPFITSDHLQKLLEQFSTSEKGIVATSHSGVNGVPAIFDKKYFTEMLALQGDQGAKRLIEKFDSVVELIAFDDAKIDIDTMEDYINAQYLSGH
ncbi:MAG: nucleotidyltransferase family protein [Ignavibacteriae bacterium]|nr:nucleotidyltransferase family protein [Ignavibacteriota bacterium]